MIQSPLFWLVLILSVPIYWRLPVGVRPGFLAAVSFLYLLTLDLASTLMLLTLSLAVFFGSRAPAEKRLVPFLVAGLCLFLGYFKYFPSLAAAVTGETLHDLVRPLGISFYTFRLIHFTLEVARGHIREPSLAHFLAYAFLFPIFTAGPIERFPHYRDHQETTWKNDIAVEGIARMSQGLIKRFVLAPLFIPALTGSALMAQLDQTSTLQAWKYVALNYLLLYIEFSAYSDLAIGASRLYGIRIAENFNFPVLATNISDYWKRWHMTLATWCQTYVYLPTIGLTRNPYLAVYATFLAMGLWHEGTLTRIGWGLYHGTGVCCHLTWTRMCRKRRWKIEGKLPAVMGWAATFLFVSGSFCFGVINGNNTLGIADALRLLAKLVFVNL